MLVNWPFCAATKTESRDKASASASTSQGGWPREPSRIAAPRNSAIEIARAPFLMFVDSEDELPEHVEP